MPEEDIDWSTETGWLADSAIPPSVPVMTSTASTSHERAGRRNAA